MRIHRARSLAAPVEVTMQLIEQNPVLRIVIPLVLFSLVLIEVFVSRKKNLGLYNLKDTLSNIVIVIGYQASKFVFLGWQAFWLGLATRFAPLHLEINIGTAVIGFLLVDFLYYWHHRAMHEIRPLWAFHEVHHSSIWMNLTVSFRLNWFSAIQAVFFFMPAALLGFPAQIIVGSIAINLLFQFFLHTELVGKLGVLEGIFNTPSAHRVHHGSNAVYLDCNYGGVLMIWDRIFGTYVAETEKPVYGVTTGFVSHNPFVLVTRGFYQLARGKFVSRG